jgi:hypothetical protein
MSAEPFLFDSFAAFAETARGSPYFGLTDQAARSRRPIILLSPLPRSGTNYLSALLALHPDCLQSRIPEDFFLANSALLIRYCDSVADSWDKWWRPRLGGLPQLARSVGAALLNFADPDPQREASSDARLLLRSPTIEGIDAASLLFPDAHILILVRSGPETVESGHRSFGWGYDDAIRAWRRSARRLLSFIENADPLRCRLVRFEDLVTDPTREISGILRFLEFDDTQYPFDRIDSVPVLGSSSFGRIDGEPVHWRPVPKTDEFDPLSRAQGWPSRRQRRSIWVGGAEQGRLGYPVQPLSITDRLLNVTLDVAHGLRRVVLCVARSVQCRPRLLSDRQGLCMTWRHIRKNL